MPGRVVLTYCKGFVKIYLPNGAQSPKLWPDEVRGWLDAGGTWAKHAIWP